MRAVIVTKYGGPDVIQLQEVEKPVPGDNEVLIRIHGVVVSATDPVFRKGDPFISRFFTGFSRPKYPVPGDVFSGEIESAGKDVTMFKAGDQVYGATPLTYGAHAEYICISQEGALAIKPENITYEEAAAVCDGGLTALPFMRDEAQVKKGQKVLVNGASGAVGSFALQLAKYYGAEVTAVCSTANSGLVTSIGADKVIDYTKDDFTQNTETYDIIFDAVGKSSFKECKNALTSRGIYLTTVPTMGMMIKMMLNIKDKGPGKRMVFAATGLRSQKEKAKDLVFLKELIEAGKIELLVDRRYPLEEISQAHGYVEKGHKKGNVLITV